MLTEKVEFLQFIHDFKLNFKTPPRFSSAKKVSEHREMKITEIQII